MGAWWNPRGLFKAPESPASPVRAAERWQRPITFSGLQLPPEISGLTGTSVPKVSRSLAMQVPAVKRARDLIVSTLGAAEAHVIDAARNTVPWELFDQPEADVPRSVTMAMTYEDLLFEKVAWWRITEYDARGWPAKVVRLEADSVTVRKSGRVYVNDRTGAAQGIVWEYVPDDQLIRFDSPNEGLLIAGAMAISTCLALVARVDQVAGDPQPLGYFTPREGAPGIGDKKEVNEFLNDWEDQRKRRQWGYVDDELEAKPLTWNPEQLQLQKLWDQAVLEIARLTGVDPEELGVSTTTRTYANAEQRRLDLLDFTVLPYAKAFEDRCKMSDVTPPGYSLVYDYTGFLRSDTKTRFETYELGLRIGVYTPERIARIEKVPTVRPQKPAAPAAPPTEDQLAKARRDRSMSSVAGFSAPSDYGGASLTFADDTSVPDGVRLNFAGDSPIGTPTFKADAATRTVSGLLVPWGQVAYSKGAWWEFAPGSLHWSDVGRVKLDKDHVGGTEFGRGAALNNAETGLTGAFKIGRSPDGDQALNYAEDGVYDGFSIEAGFESEADGWIEHPTKPGVRLVQSATLRKVALTAMPAFDDARVTQVAATREGNTHMTAPTAPAGTGPAGAAGTPPAMDWAAFTAGLTTAVTAAVETAAKTAFASLPTPQAVDGIPARDPNATVTAGRAVVTREEPIYLMNGHGNSYVRDAWKARTEGDHEATDRLRKFMRQTEEASKDAMSHEAAQFAANTGNSSAVIPPGYRPDLFVTQLMQGRPLVTSVSRGTLSDATPFNIPAYVSSSGLSSEHVEGVNPTAGSLVLGVKTVSPTAVSGLFELTREIVDSANPAIDAIAFAAMQESYSQQTEALVYAELNGTNGAGGVITNGFVPSGAQAATTTGQGDELLTGTRAAMAVYPFRRFGAMNRAHISQEATQGFSSAVDTTGRPLLPYVGAQNSSGTAQAAMQGYMIDGVVFQPTWSMTGNAAGDSDVLMFNSADVWAWESGLLMFRFEERGGPARIDLALFGYFATRILRPVGLSGVRHTAS